ncbi:tellurite resistance TerB family protein [Rhizobium sp. CFBP 8762]|uniref:tellurite resistance TerB family protein n=1 Tax=Rhizobium sp. CFBP 8762 TaxID=2775279 RepID=UPI00177BF3C7|nr:TerB family tellurite resistance protein [Rhizobium sp. CFBP 8762]MBD8554892.1 tellurite resistance TerB family protein [Rhizobium sp. CFBP 8762]
MFGSLKAKFSGSVNKYSGRKDFLEAVCAAAALVAAADGDISDAEVDQTVKAVASNVNLSAAFKPAEIERVADAMLKRAQGGRVGRNGLYKEIEQIASDPEMAETVLLSSLDVADQGGIDAKEKDVLDKIARSLGLNLASYDV